MNQAEQEGGGQSMFEIFMGSLLVFTASSIVVLLLEIKGSREIKKLREELERVFPNMNFSKITEDMPVHTKKVLLKRDVERLKLCALCHLCQERELRDNRKTIEREQRED